MGNGKKMIAVIGMGKMGLFHLSILRRLSKVQVVGLMDKSPGLKKMAAGMGLDAPFYDSIERLLDEAHPHGVFVCTPPVYNPDIAEACVRRGVSVFVEKPLASNLEGATRILNLLNGRTVAHAVGYMVAYNPVFEKARALLVAGAIGKVTRYRSGAYLGEVFKRQPGWRQDRGQSGGGAVTIIGSHMLFLIQQFFGLPISIEARTWSLYSKVEDMAQANFEHESGARGFFDVSWSRPGTPAMCYSMTVEGDRGLLEMTEDGVSVMALSGNSSLGEGPHQWKPWDLPDPSPYDPGQPGFFEQDREFVEAIGGESKGIRSDWRQGFLVQSIIDAIYRSAESGAAVEPVGLP